MDSQARYKETEDERTRRANYVLRLVALVTTFIAAIVAGAARETEPIATTDRVGVHLKVKAAGTPQFDYFVAVNAIVCFYSAASIAFWVMTKGGTKNLIFVLTIIDMVAMILLFSGLGSASAMAILFRKGISLASLYPRICNVYDNFCKQIFAAITISTVASIAYLVLIFIAHLRLHYSSL